MHSFGERCRASIGFLFFLLVPPLLTAQERSECNPANTQSIVKSALECYVLQQVRHGQPAYLQGRILRSEFLEELLRLAPSLKIHPPRVVIEEGVFNERLSFRNETVPLELHLSHCRFLRGVDFSLSHFLVSKAQM